MSSTAAEEVVAETAKPFANDDSELLLDDILPTIFDFSHFWLASDL